MLLHSAVSGVRRVLLGLRGEVRKDQHFGTESEAQFCAFRGEVPARAVPKASIFERLKMGDRPCDHLFDGSEKPGGRVAYHARVKPWELVDQGQSAS